MPWPYLAPAATGWSPGWPGRSAGDPSSSARRRHRGPRRPPGHHRRTAWHGGIRAGARVPDGTDLTDFLRSHGWPDPRARAALLALRDRAEQWEPPPAEAEQPASRFRLLTTTEMENRPPLSWLVPGRLPAGEPTTMYGASGGGKSLVAIDWAHLVAHLHGPVLYVAAEGGSAIGTRTRAWRAHHGHDAGRRITWIDEPVIFNDATDLAHVIAAMESMPEPPGSCWSSTPWPAAWSATRTAPRIWAASWPEWNQARRPFGAASLTLHHTGHDHSRERGHSSLKAASFPRSGSPPPPATPSP